MAKLKNYDKFLKAVSRIKIDARYDVPYFAGYNWDCTKIYIDKDVPKSITISKVKLNLHLSLAIHEYIEKQHINEGYTYAAAHEIAMSYEKKYVISHGINWKDYDKEVGKLMHANWIAKLNSVPKDLDLTPYEYSRDLKTLAKVRRFLVK